MAECYLKWEDDTIGVIHEDNTVSLTHSDLNPTTQVIFHGKNELTAEQWKLFLEDRIVSKSRKDIDKFLFRCGMSTYDVFRLAKMTRAINPKDKLWIAYSSSESYAACVEKTLSDVFLHNIGIDGGSIHSPDGANIKWYGTFQNQYGVFKKRLSPVQTDVESELAVSAIAKRMRIPCCETYRVDHDTIFSAFAYDFNREYIVHFGNLFQDGQRQENEVKGILDIRPQYKKQIFQMLALDFVTRQDDRHLSNFAVKVSGDQESFYPLYDNGRSLFFEDSPTTMEQILTNIPANATTFGAVGTYWDHIKDMLDNDPSLLQSVNLNITEPEIENILKDAGFSDYRLEGAKTWLCTTMDELKSLSREIDA